MAEKSLFGNSGKGITLDDLNDFKTAEEIEQESGTQPQEETKAEEKPQPEEKPKEEPEVEQKAEEQVPKEEPTEEPKSEPAEEATEEATGEATGEEKPEETGQFDFAAFNKLIGKNYESIDQVKDDLDKPTMETEYQEAKTQSEELQSKYTDLEETVNLLTEQLESTSGLSDDVLKLEVFKKENPNKDASIASKVFSTEDLSSIDDLEMVKMGQRFKNPKLPGTDADLEAAIKEELNIDPETPRNEWPNTAQIRLATMAGEYRDAFDQMRSSVSLPDKVNIDELKAKRKQASEERLNAITEGWSEIADESLKSTNQVKLPIGTPKEGEEQKYFEWKLDNAPQQEVDQLRENYVNLGLDPSGESKESFQRALNLSLIEQNLPQIMQKYGEEIEANLKEKHLEESHNPEPLKDSQRTETSQDKVKEERNRFAMEIGGRALHGHPLFKST